MRRYALKDEQWEKIESSLLGKEGDRGSNSFLTEEQRR